MINKIKSYGYLFIIFLVIIFVVYFFINRSFYISITDFCTIRIVDDSIRGNKETLFQAIKLLKQKDNESYILLCKYIDSIEESYCPISIENSDTFTYSKESGCYIKGSKTINITPEKEFSEQLVQQRADTLRKYAKFSQIFWDNINK